MAKIISMRVENRVWSQVRKNYLSLVIAGALSIAGGLTIANHFQTKKDEIPVVASSQPLLEERVIPDSSKPLPEKHAAVPEPQPPEISPEAQPYLERAIGYIKENYSTDNLTLYSYIHKTTKWDWNLITKKGDFGYLFLFRSPSIHLGLVVDPLSVISEEFKYQPSERERGVIQALEEVVGKRSIVQNVLQVKTQNILESPLFAEDFPKPVSDELFHITLVRGRGDKVGGYETEDYYLDFKAGFIFGYQSSM